MFIIQQGVQQQLSAGDLFGASPLNIDLFQLHALDHVQVLSCDSVEYRAQK